MLLFTLLFAKIALVWLGLTIIAFGIHVFTRDYYSLSVGIGAAITFVAIQMGYQGLLTQVLVFCISTFIFMASFIPLMIQKSNAKRMHAQTPTFELHGRVALVVKTVDNMNTQGTIEVDGQQYKARAADGNIKPSGHNVTIVDKDKDILIVR